MGIQKSKLKQNHTIFDLTNVDPQSIDNVIFKDQIVSVYIYDVYDGDTVKFLALLGNTVIKLALRLIGIDTPEIRAGVDHLIEEKNAGIIAREKVKELINFSDKKHLTNIIIRDWDKYGGRVLGEIILEDGRFISDILIDEGYAKHYQGDKKELWTLEELTSKPFIK